MSRNIQFIPVPYISAVDINQYLDKFGLAISTTGNYYVFPYANDPFNGYPTGFNIHVSGSGFWQGSGFTFIPVDYFYENFGSYATGFNSGYFLSGVQTSGYNLFSPLLYSGLMTSNVDYMYENFGSYATGLFTTSFLIDGNTFSGYSNYYPNFYSGVFNFLTVVHSGTYIYSTTDNANTGYVWSGSGINVNPGAGQTFPYLQFNAPNSLSFNQGAGTGGFGGGGPFYAGGSGNIPYPWTGGGPVLVGNTAVGQINSFGLLKTVSGGFVSMSGFGTGVITGDFTLNIIWNWPQNLTANSYNSWISNAPFPYGPQYIANFTGIGTGLGTANQLGQALNIVSLEARPTVGGPAPDAINFGPDYRFPSQYNISAQFKNPYINNLNQDTSLIDWDMISGFAIYIYTSMWSGVTWIGPLTGEAVGVLPYGNSTLPNNFYTGISSGLMSNIYAFVLGNKISGSIVTTNPPTGFMSATGITSFTGNFIKYQPLSTGLYSETGWFGGVTGIVASGPFAQFTGFGFGISQYITLTRSGTLVSLYQSGILFATGFASGAINTPSGSTNVKPVLIGEFNRQTGSFTGSYSGFGLYHFEMWNYCQSQQTIQSNLLTYNKPPQTGITTYNPSLTGALISSTNFILT